MLFNPFKYQYEADYLSDEDTQALLLLRKGTLEEHIRLPRSLLPLEVKPGDHFVLNLQSPESAHNSEADALKKLLEDLIR
jgi:hypothetical protein